MLMFKQDKTSEIIDFLNSLIGLSKINDFQNLYNEALIELYKRTPILATLYQYYYEFR